jgi:hypothetical protein
MRDIYIHVCSVIGEDPHPFHETTDTEVGLSSRGKEKGFMSSEGDVGLQWSFAASCCTVYSELAVSILTIPMQLHRHIKIHASKAFLSSCYSNITCFGTTSRHQVYML